MFTAVFNRLSAKTLYCYYHDDRLDVVRYYSNLSGDLIAFAIRVFFDTMNAIC